MSNIEYRKQPHICLCLVLFLVLVVVDNAHSTSKAFSTVHPSDLLFRLVQSGQTVSLGAAASLVLFFFYFLIHGDRESLHTNSYSAGPLIRPLGAAVV